MTAVKWHSREALRKDKARASMRENVNLNDHMRLSEMGNGLTVAEFVSAGQFADGWYERQRYEVFAGRDEEPELWRPIYEVIQDASLPESIPIHTLGPAGVTFEEVKEGGEVKFLTVSESEKTVRIRQYGVGLQYTKKMVLFNQLWQMGFIERQAGVAHNALMNHIHLNPITSYSYGADNQTAASSVGANILEKYMSTIEDAIENSRSASPKRRGPYVLLINPAQALKVQNALNYRVQDGNGQPRAGAGLIQSVIEYDGWSGTRGAKTVTYSGVTSGKAYLVSLQYRAQDFLSFIKQPLDSAMGNPDVSRFILEQTVWDVWFGMYSSPANAVEEITWPTS